MLTLVSKKARIPKVLPPINAETPKPLPDSFELREVQQLMHRNTAQAYIDGYRHMVVQGPTGCGKTIFAGYLFWKALTKNPNQRVVFIVPRTNLLEQAANELARVYGFECSIIRGNDQRLDFTKQVQVATIQTLASRMKSDDPDISEVFNAIEWGVAVVDECFTGDTLISVPSGFKKIKDLKVGDEVCNAIGTGQVIATKKATSNHILKIRISDGTTIKCTENHPFFTNSGWKKAGKLGIGERLFSKQDVSCLWNDNEAKNLRQTRQADSERVRKGVECKNNLLQVLLEEIQESNAGCKSKKKDAGHIESHEAQAKSSRGQWPWINSATRKVIEYLGVGLGRRICSMHKEESMAGEADAVSLQDRFGQRAVDDSNRNRRLFSLFDKEKGAGCPENCFFGAVRVESIEVDESRSNEPVYNLHISGHPSYYAENVLVHNCHIQFDGVSLVKEKAKLLIGLTATPFSPGMGLTYDHLVKSISAHELTKNGVITPIRVKAAERQVDTSKLSTSSTGEYSYEEEAAAFSEIVGDVYEEWATSEDMQGRPFLGFAKDIATCVSLTNLFKENGVRAECVHSKMSDDDVEAIFQLYRDGFVTGIFSVVKMIEGADFPSASALLLCTSFAPSRDDPNIPNSRNRYVQMLGRVRRSCEGKSYALIHDHGENYIKYGHPDNIEIGFDELDDGKPKQDDDIEEEVLERIVKPVVCPECASYIDVGNICQHCGHELKKYTEIIDGNVVHFADGEMVEIETVNLKSAMMEKKTYSMAEKQAIYSGILFEANHREREKRMQGESWPKKKGWIAFKFKEIVGTWPNHPTIKELPPMQNKGVERIIDYLEKQFIKKSKLKQRSAA